MLYELFAAKQSRPQRKALHSAEKVKKIHKQIRKKPRIRFHFDPEDHPQESNRPPTPFRSNNNSFQSKHFVSTSQNLRKVLATILDRLYMRGEPYSSVSPLLPDKSVVSIEQFSQVLQEAVLKSVNYYRSTLNLHSIRSRQLTDMGVADLKAHWEEVSNTLKMVNNNLEEMRNRNRQVIFLIERYGIVYSKEGVDVGQDCVGRLCENNVFLENIKKICASALESLKLSESDHRLVKRTLDILNGRKTKPKSKRRRNQSLHSQTTTTETLTTTTQTGTVKEQSEINDEYDEIASNIDKSNRQLDDQSSSRQVCNQDQAAKTTSSREKNQYKNQQIQEILDDMKEMKQIAWMVRQIGRLKLEAGAYRVRAPVRLKHLLRR